MATIADELLQDFEDFDEEEVADDDAPEENAHAGRKSTLGDMSDVEEDDEDEEMIDAADGAKALGDDAEEAKAKVEKMKLGVVKDVRSVATLMDTLIPVLEKIERCRSQGQTNVVGNVEDHPEYQLLTQSNGLSTHIDSEIVLVHKFIRDHYSARFPELETLISNPLEYAKVVAILGNGPMDADGIKKLQNSTDNPLKTSLRSVLDGPSLMIVTVEATTTKGHEMSEDELGRVLRACEMIVSLDKAKATLTEYVQSRMNIFAPNLTALIGSLTAAQLLNAAGGLTGLSKTPACNIAAWGSKRQATPGLATNVGIRQQGFIYHSPMIRGIPNDLKRQAMRIVSAKLVMAARRALPAPDDKPSKKRGGRRARKAKEATAMTDLRKAQNRMAFGKEEAEVGYGTGDGTAGLGMIGQANDGRIRALQIDQRTRAKLSAKHKGWGGATPLNGLSSSLRGFNQASSNIDLRGKGLRASGVGSTIGGGGTAGTASSLTFTPVQGLELVDPKVREELSRKRKADEDRWFKGGTFTQVGQASSNGGFKIPSLPPPAKKVDTGAGKMLPPPIP
ncbi:unnamed protein product [Parascedosporium putredinis]|uniref:Nop domain-containing protein n=1 Tax=Parascedosporium putredinis TaxID=1442378 RepID=A0A9P1M9U8_9PEZI|nr:unnamed protein product [Parascedosporium putredinis]CAI7992756.1 unnamed protein product [Parascedosporium putredinis]